MRAIKNLIVFLLLYNLSYGNQIVLPYFSSWKYLDDGSNPSTTWKNTSFNDSLWKSGYAQLGYGDNDESTVVSYGSNSSAKYITTYFRKKVSISDPNLFTDFTLNVRRDDGVVVYVNGTEVYRNNMPASPTVITYTTLASTAAADDGETPQSASISKSFFISGINTVAVEVHQNAGTSTDLSFDMELIGNQSGTTSLTRGPYLMVATPTGIKVRWRTSSACDSKVSYGSNAANLNLQVSDAALVTEHIVSLTGLLPNTKYYYSIGGSSFSLVGNEDNFFITPPLVNTIKPTRIWATGDFGSGSVNSSMVRNAYLNYTGTNYTDLWIWLGDNAYASGLDTEYSTNVFNYRYERVFRSTCVWPAPGNHDYANVGYQSASALGTAFPYFSIFSTPQAGEAGGVASGTPKYYSYDYANIHFISLDSYGALNTAGSAMYTWLQSDLAANTKRWTIVYFHHAPYSKGSHDSDTEIELVNMRNNIIPLLESYKVDLVLSGHSHSYERSFLIRNHFGLETTFSAANQVSAGSGTFPNPYIKTNTNGNIGTVYAVVGCAGQTVGGTKPGYPHNAMYLSDVATYGSMVIDINGDTLNAKLITSNLTTPTVLDQFTILKQCSLTVSLDSIAPVFLNASPFTLTGGHPANGTYSGTGVTQGIFYPLTAGKGNFPINYFYADAFGCAANAVRSIRVMDTISVLNARMYLEGLYNSSGLMNSAVSGIADTVTLKLASAVFPYTILAQQKSTLSNNGNSTTSFPMIPDFQNYYLVVDHRNSLQTWSAAPVTFTNSSCTYDFTQSNASAFGNQLKNMGNGTYAIYSGDVNKDGFIDQADIIQLENSSKQFIYGYISADLNGDGVVELTDGSMLENNAALNLFIFKP